MTHIEFIEQKIQAFQGTMMMVIMMRLDDNNNNVSGTFDGKNPYESYLKSTIERNVGNLKHSLTIKSRLLFSTN